MTSCLILSGILQGGSRNGLKPWVKRGFSTSLVVAAELRLPDILVKTAKSYYTVTRKIFLANWG
jgi:hypothetical protein